MVLCNGMHPQEVHILYNSSCIFTKLLVIVETLPTFFITSLQLKDSVCSPAGTAIQGIRLLERNGFRGIMMDAVHAASKRALELSKLQNGNGEETDVYVKR